MILVKTEGVKLPMANRLSTTNAGPPIKYVDRILKSDVLRIYKSDAQIANALGLSRAAPNLWGRWVPDKHVLTLIKLNPPLRRKVRRVRVRYRKVVQYHYVRVSEGM